MSLPLGLISCLLTLSAALPAQAQDVQALRSRHASLADKLAHSAFNRPLVLESTDSSEAPSGDVYAVIDEPFAALRDALGRAEPWCDILMLQTNIKRCAASGSAPNETIRFSIARRMHDPVGDAQALAFRFTAQADAADYLAIQLGTAEGPVGTRNYRLGFEAVALDDKRSFVHMSYAYTTSLMARMATSLYLASAGRDKVGFSSTGRDASGKPVYVTGIQGVAERNTMRYFLAIDAHLDTRDAQAAQRSDARLRRFHAALERYPAQLHELDEPEYLAMKRRELPGR